MPDDNYDDDYDWADDETLTAEQFDQIFESLGPEIEITGPPTGTLITEGFQPPPPRLTFTYGKKTERRFIPSADAVAVEVDPAAVCPTG